MQCAGKKKVMNEEPKRTCGLLSGATDHFQSSETNFEVQVVKVLEMAGKVEHQ